MRTRGSGSHSNSRRRLQRGDPCSVTVLHQGLLRSAPLRPSNNIQGLLAFMALEVFFVGKLYNGLNFEIAAQESGSVLREGSLL
jgi:hypothetical protein